MEGFRSKEEMPKGGHDKAAQEAADKGDHNSNLFDMNEDMYGNRIDPVTGQPYENSPATAGTDEELSEVEQGDDESEDALGKIPEEHDAAAQWLREHAEKHARKSKK